MTRRDTPYVCGIDAAVDVIGGKWKVLVLWELTAHPTRRFAELRDALAGVSEKVLTAQLRELERDGVVTRTDHHTTAPHVEYGLTEAGRELTVALRDLGDWGTRHRSRLERVRAAASGAIGERQPVTGRRTLRGG